MTRAKHAQPGLPLASVKGRATTIGRLCVWLLLLIALPIDVRAGQLVRIKDVTDIEGARVNRLRGMGLVTGLNGTGGKTPLTRQTALNLVQRFGIRADDIQRLGILNDAKQKTDNLSVVMVTAEIPPFLRPGQRVDVLVSVLDDASSLQGGVLLLTPLKGIDGIEYALAEGGVSIGGFSFEAEAGSVQKNHPTTGRIPGGAILEEPIMTEVCYDGRISLQLKQADYETSHRIAAAVNHRFPVSAHCEDSGTVRIRVPGDWLGDVPGFIGEVEKLEIIPDIPARVVINERTGTIIAGENVRISRVVITHGNLSVITNEQPQVSQPAPFSDGVTAVVPRSEIDVLEEHGAMTVLDDTVTVSDLANGLNALGVSPRDLSSIFQQLKEAGALHAELVFK